MSRVKCDTRLLDSLIRQTAGGDISARAGFFEDSGKHPRSGEDAYYIAAVNNNGDVGLKIPPRPFVTDGAAEGEMKSELILKNAIRKAHQGRTTFKRAHREASEVQKDFILAQLILGPFLYDANAQSTVDSKGFNAPLYEIGWLQKQIEIKYD